ncbi:MAG: hypothetical protein Q9178_003190 [Gyalolechia marmorata]
MAVTTKATIASFGGKLLKCAHNASTTSCEMAFNLYLPPQATINPLHKVPLLIYLAGLTCTADNGAEKGFFQHAASQKGIAILYPDTSPRGLQIPGEDDSYDFGSGAGFYVDATKDPWSKGYKMYSYITSELPKTVFDAFEQVDGSRVSIFGHSMGGHGALTLVNIYFPFHSGRPPTPPIKGRGRCLLHSEIQSKIIPQDMSDYHPVPQEPG